MSGIAVVVAGTGSEAIAKHAIESSGELFAKKPDEVTTVEPQPTLDKKESRDQESR